MTETTNQSSESTPQADNGCEMNNQFEPNYQQNVPYYEQPQLMYLCSPPLINAMFQPWGEMPYPIICPIEQPYYPSPRNDVMIPYQQTRQIEDFYDGQWRDHFAKGTANGRIVQEFIDMNYNINKYVSYTHKQHIRYRPAIEIAYFNRQYFQVMLLAMFGAEITPNLLKLTNDHFNKLKYKNYTFHKILSFYSNAYEPMISRWFENRETKTDRVGFTYDEHMQRYNHFRDKYFKSVENEFYEYIEHFINNVEHNEKVIFIDTWCGHIQPILRQMK